MLELTVMGETILCCNKEEASHLWREKPEERHRIWMESEASAHMRDTPEQIMAVMEKKREKPGLYL